MKLPQWSSVDDKSNIDVRPCAPEIRDEPTVLARCLFFDHGHELAEAAAMLGGAYAEAKVVSCALQLQDADRITPCIRRNLVSLHRLLSLDRVGDPECLETALFSEIDPASRQVEMICLLTDMLAEILGAIDASDQTLAKTAVVDLVAAA